MLAASTIIDFHVNISTKKQKELLMLINMKSSLMILKKI
jgi:hypothetical protein